MLHKRLEKGNRGGTEGHFKAKELAKRLATEREIGACACPRACMQGSRLKREADGMSLNTYLVMRLSGDSPGKETK